MKSRIKRTRRWCSVF